MPTSSGRTEVRLRVTASPVDGLVGREIELAGDGTELTIGRSPDCSLPVADAAMSRRHARVALRQESAFVVDNASANGVFVGGERVAERLLGDGGRFRLGGTEFEVIVERPAPPEPAPTPPVPAFPDGRTVIQPPVDRTISISDIAEIVRNIEKPKGFEDEGEVVIVAANRPFVLSDPDSVYLVESGRIEIFTVALEQGQPSGARTHFVTVEAGGLFFGMDTDRYGMGSGFLATGKAGSELRRFSAARLMRMAAEREAHRQRIAPLVARWIKALSRRLIVDLEVRGRTSRSRRASRSRRRPASGCRASAQSPGSRCRRRSSCSTACRALRGSSKACSCRSRRAAGSSSSAAPTRSREPRARPPTGSAIRAPGLGSRRFTACSAKGSSSTSAFRTSTSSSA
jgi:pSer/pThr/pTyr-binding forkhead associated (FHA) protein